MLLVFAVGIIHTFFYFKRSENVMLKPPWRSGMYFIINTIVSGSVTTQGNLLFSSFRPSR